MKFRDSYFWLFVEHEDHSFPSDIRDRKFANELLELKEDGQITIRGSHVFPNGKTGYAWDGCSPKWAILDIVFGIPDGAVHPVTEKPMTYYASMVHDVLYQFGHSAGIKRKEADKLFLTMMKDFRPRYFYYLVVRLLGRCFFGRSGNKN